MWFLETSSLSWCINVRMYTPLSTLFLFHFPLFSLSASHSLTLLSHSLLSLPLTLTFSHFVTSRCAFMSGQVDPTRRSPAGLNSPPRLVYDYQVVL
jgi:hypothetical protein